MKKWTTAIETLNFQKSYYNDMAQFYSYIFV